VKGVVVVGDDDVVLIDLDLIGFLVPERKRGTIICVVLFVCFVLFGRRHLFVLHHTKEVSNDQDILGRKRNVDVV
jgi:hypothetical protein